MDGRSEVWTCSLTRFVWHLILFHSWIACIGLPLPLIVSFFEDCYNFTASKTTARPGDSITFTWGPSRVLVNGAIPEKYQFTVFADGEYIKIPNAGNIPLTETSFTFEFPEGVSNYAICYVSIVGNVANVDMEDVPGDQGVSGINSSENINIYVDYSPVDPEPPDPGPDPGPTPTPGGARLEQFQNSSAENIYPKTIVEGVFRQSDGKTLAELLEESGGSGGVESFNGRTGAVTPQTGDYTAAQVGAVPTSRKVNGQALNGDITLITCGTADLIAGSSRLAAGTLYGVYEG